MTGTTGLHTIPAPRPDLPRVALLEEGMREGLQIEDSAIPVGDKVRLLDSLSRTGLRNIVVGSFVSPKWTPQMAGIDELVRSFTPVEGVAYTALALNQRGVERRAAYIPERLTLVESRPATRAHLCDVFAQRNTNRTQEQEIASWDGIVAAAVEAGQTEAEIGVGAAWGSNWVGAFSHAERMDMLQRQYDLWEDAGVTVRKVFFADPMGWNVPWQLEEDLQELRRRWPEVREVHLHLHDTRGMAGISLYTALRCLDETFTVTADTSIGGMAGCPYCGNGRAATLYPTEDFVVMLDALGYDTGVDIDRLIDTVVLAEEIVGHRLYGHVSKSGPRVSGARLYPMELPFIETLEQAQHFRSGPAVYQGALSPWRHPIRSWQRPEATSDKETEEPSNG
jgi:hydroxymethylglutaryl-CoA lyase